MTVTNIAEAKNRSTGPRTEDGKSRAALNSVKWGLGAKNLLMIGEDPTEFEARADAVFSSLAPENAAEAEVVALIFDDMWKLERAAKIEKGLCVGRIEELLEKTTPAIAGAKLAPALHSVGKAIEEWERQPCPAEADDGLRERAQELNAVINDLAGVEGVAMQDLADLQIALVPLVDRNARIMPIDLAKLTSEISQRVRVVMAKLLNQGAHLETQLEELRKSIATVSLPSQAELQKLARYVSMLEQSLTRRTAALEQMRKLRPAQPVTDAANDKSREFRMKLRVVK